MANEDEQGGRQQADPGEIGKWTRRYGQTRTIPFVLTMALSIFLFAAIGGLSYLSGQAFRAGNTLLFHICLPALGVVLVGLFWFSIPRWGGKAMQRLAERIYAKEGTVTLPPAKPAVPKWVQIVVGVIFGACIVASIHLSRAFSWPIKYMQPISAIYCVPFMVFLGYTRRGEGSPLMMLWPAMYALHAILIVAGAPIVFAGRWTALNMLVPIAGYGLLLGLLGHVYSRFALRRLRRAARAGLDAQGGAGEEAQP